MEALKVQAVAARSYALSSQWQPYAKTCDTTSCQVYGGAWTGPLGGGRTSAEDARTDAAVWATSGQVRRKPGGAIARTEFSASTGGWTAGGDFPAVEDLGDQTTANPNRAWSVSLGRTDVANRLGIPAITDVRVTQRNGLGADGGRALQVVFETIGGPKSFTGNQVRIAMGLKSDWFTISTVSTAGSRAFAQALYVDVLGRDGEPSGIDHYATVLATGTSRHAVALGFAGSAERYGRWVRTVYNDALQRPAEPGAEAFWSGYLASGATLNNLNAGVYGSDESVIRLGGGDVSVWVDAVYQKLLGRGAGGGERSVWADRAARYGLQSVVMAISQSTEACNRRLNQYYWELLGRGVDASGLSTWAPNLAGDGDVTMVAAIATSLEYRYRAEARFP
jgi:SpoIID/LytB domain protein